MIKVAATTVVERDPSAAEADVAGEAYRIPVLDKAVQVLDLLLAHRDGLSINALVESTGVARSTVYRILNTFSSHGVVTRRMSGRYQLGLKLVALAGGVPSEIGREDLVQICHERLERLAAETTETCKLSVISGLRAEVIDVAQSSNDLAPTSRVGSTFSLHAGAASKLLLAFEPEETLDRLFREPILALTAATITDRRTLARELERIGKDELSFDRGEWNVNVHAVAAPIFGHGRRLVAALSVTHFANGDEDERRPRVIEPLRSAAQELSAKLGYLGSAAAART